MPRCLEGAMAEDQGSGNTRSEGVADGRMDPPPPPPGAAVAAAPEGRSAVAPLTSRGSERLEASIEVAKARPKGRAFDAELDVSEIDERGRPGPTWIARARMLSRSNVVFASSKMCYVGRDLIVAIHLIDSTPVPLFGRVFSCEYDTDGMHIVDMELAEVPRDRRSVSIPE